MRYDRYIQPEAFEYEAEASFGESEAGFETEGGFGPFETEGESGMGEFAAESSFGEFQSEFGETETGFGTFEAFEFAQPNEWEQEGGATPSCPPPVTNVDCPPPGTTPDLVLDNFAFDRSTLIPARHAAPLQAFATAVIASMGTSRPALSILIAGHTEPVGDDDYNFKLGWRRAREVLAQFCKVLEGMSPGITAKIKFELTSCGERQPKSTPEQSRRAEFFLRKKAARPPRQIIRPRPPVRPRCRFRASVHGLKFVNSFTLPSALTGALSKLQSQVGSGAYGLCGGMSFLAADHFTFGVAVPSTTSIPATGSSLYNQILRRQLDSLALTSISLGFGAPVLKFHEWMGLPDRGAGSTAALTLAEVRGAAAALRRGRPVIFGLVQAKYPGGSLTENHQVVAHCIRPVGPSKFAIDIYDPNHPLIDTVKIEISVSGAEALSTHVSPGRRRSIRGIFVMPYTPVKP